MGQGHGRHGHISNDASGLWAVVKMPPLKGGDDWSHYWHGPDLNTVSQDSAVVATNYQLQSEGYPLFSYAQFYQCGCVCRSLFYCQLLASSLTTS